MPVTPCWLVLVRQTRPQRYCRVQEGLCRASHTILLKCVKRYGRAALFYYIWTVIWPCLERAKRGWDSPPPTYSMKQTLPSFVSLYIGINTPYSWNGLQGVVCRENIHRIPYMLIISRSVSNDKPFSCWGTSHTGANQIKLLGKGWEKCCRRVVLWRKTRQTNAFSPSFPSLQHQASQ